MNLYQNKVLDLHCVHTKNIYSLIDLQPQDEQYLSLIKHIDHCPACKLAVRNFEQSVLASQVYIPRPVMDKDLKDSFERELHDILVNLGINDKGSRRVKIKTWLEKSNTLGESLAEAFKSKILLFSIAFAGLLILAFRQFN